MTFTQLKYVVTVAELSSFNSASRKLFVSQSSISTAVKELEEELGISIFNRTNRGIVLTNEGTEFVYYAKNILLQMNDLEGRYLLAERKKRFSVTMHHSTFATKLFSDVVKEFGLSDYEYCLYETQTSKVIEDIDRAKSELGVLYLSEFNRRYYDRIFKEHNLEFKEIGEFEVYVYIGSEHPLADRKQISLKELEEYPCLIFDQGENSSFYFYEEIISAYEYKNIIRTSDRATNLNLVKQLNGYSVGVGVLQEKSVQDEFAAVKLDTKERIKVGVLTRTGHELSAPAKRYVELFSRFCAGDPAI